MCLTSSSSMWIMDSPAHMLHCFKTVAELIAFALATSLKEEHLPPEIIQMLITSTKV